IIATQGNGNGNLNNTLLIFDRKQQLAQQVLAVAFPPPPSTPTGIPAPQARPVTTFRGKLQRTPDGNLIVGVSQNGNTTILYIYRRDCTCRYFRSGTTSYKPPENPAYRALRKSA